MWRYLSLAMFLVAASTLAGCGASGNGDVTATQDGANTINGTVRVPAGVHSGAVATVNGSINIEEKATAGAARAVNGQIQVGPQATAESVTNVNGAVTVASAGHVTGGITTVNGSITLNSGADVGGTVRNVNGHISLTAAHVAQGLRTVDGSIEVNGESHVEGGILVQKPTGAWFGWHSNKPRIVIGPGAVVQGNLRFERDVLLYVSEKATVGPIEGATAIRFSGEQPPA